MLAVTSKTYEPVSPTEQDTLLAESSSQQLAAFVQDEDEVQKIVVMENGTSTEVNIPAVAFRMLVNVLTQMAQGNAITIIPIQAELTTQQAADVLNVSRPFLIELLEKGQIPFRKVGTRRKVLLKDVMDYKKRTDDARLKILEELAAQAQELNMGY